MTLSCISESENSKLKTNHKRLKTRTDINKNRNRKFVFIQQTNAWYLRIIHKMDLSSYKSNKWNDINSES